MFLLYFFTAAVVSALLVPVVRPFMLKYGAVDLPQKKSRKIHDRPIALGGGLAIFLSFFLLLALMIWGTGDVGQDIRLKALLGLFLGSVVLMIGGFLDDKYRLPPAKQIIFPVLASLIAIACGIGLESISNPTGGELFLNQIAFSIEGLGNLVLLADMVVFLWLMGMMMTTKFLDGMDGLVAGMVTIGAIMVYIVSQQPQWFQPEVGLVAVTFAGACFGFLLWNFHPAKIFLGDGGSLFTGFVLGILAIISGSKIATTLLVMGVPILDVARVIVVRIMSGRSAFAGDAEHLHYRLLHAGLNQKQTVLLLYGISFLFGMSTLFLQSHQKMIALSFLFVLMLLVGVWFSKQKAK